MTLRITINLLFIMFFTQCKVNYSFSGVNIDAETMSISNFYNDADNGPPDLAQVFTDELRDYFQRNTNLQLVNDNAELIFEGAVKSYTVTPATTSAGSTSTGYQTSNQNRLTIVVSVSYTNLKNDEFDFEKNFQAFVDFDSNQLISDVEEELIDEIYEQIILNIFNDSVANW